MDRKGQVSNVAFGGAWLESIPRRERLADAVAMIEAAPGRTEDEDLREDAELAAAVSDVCAAHPKGGQLRASWAHALTIGAPGIRRQEIARISVALAAWVRG